MLFTSHHLSVWDVVTGTAILPPTTTLDLTTSFQCAFIQKLGPALPFVSRNRKYHIAGAPGGA